MKFGISNISRLFLLIILMTALTSCANGNRVCSPESALEGDKTLQYVRANSQKIDSLINEAFSDFNKNNAFNQNVRLGGFAFTNYMPISKLNSSIAQSHCGAEIFYTMSNSSEQKRSKEYIDKYFYDIRGLANEVLDEFLAKGGHGNVYSVSAFSIYDTAATTGWDLPYCCQTCDRRGSCGGPQVTCCEIGCGCCSR